MNLPPYPSPRKRAKNMNESTPRPSRCTTGLRVASMGGVTTYHLDVPQHFTVWTLHHHETLLASSTDWADMARAVGSWTGHYA